jgi:two-component system, chemotaxis family, chemotaxis protein CheY
MACILLVDDDRPLRVAIRTVLVAKGHRVVEAQDGREAIQRCETEKPDLVVTDIQMPEIDGLGLVMALRRLRPHIPVVVMTGVPVRGSLDHIKAAETLGAALVLEKPFTATVFMDAIQPFLPPPEKRA